MRTPSRDLFSWVSILGCIVLVALAADVAAGGPLAVTLLGGAVVAVGIAAGLLIADRSWRGSSFPLWLPAMAPAIGVLAGLVAVVAGLTALGVLLALVSAGVLASLVARDPERWREAARSVSGSAFGSFGSRATPAPVAAAPAPKPVRLTPSDRAARFAAEVFALDAAQLEALIEAWSGIDRHDRAAAWDAARPYLTAADRKELLTEVREELKRWSAGAAHGEGAPSQEIETQLRRRAGRALLDAAAGIIVQDRISKHDFDLLYAPFRTAVTGEALHIARRPRGSADASAGRSKTQRKHDDAGGPVVETAEPATVGTASK